MIFLRLIFSFGVLPFRLKIIPLLRWVEKKSRRIHKCFLDKLEILLCQVQDSIDRYCKESRISAPCVLVFGPFKMLLGDMIHTKNSQATPCVPILLLPGNS